MAKRKAKKRARKRSKPRTRRRGGAAGKLPKSAVTLIVMLRAKEGQETLLEAELRALVNPTRKEQGCLTYQVHHSADAPGGFLLREVWATREDHTAHTRTQHFLRWNARKDSLLVSREATFWKQIV
jgi:quinol monooxygenase YgiN